MRPVTVLVKSILNSDLLSLGLKSQATFEENLMKMKVDFPETSQTSKISSLTFWIGRDHLNNTGNN